MFVFIALFEFAVVNYASRRDARDSKAAKSNHTYFYEGELGMWEIHNKYRKMSVIGTFHLSISFIYLKNT